VKTLKWKNKIFNKEKDLNLDIFGNRSPEKDNHYKAEKKEENHSQYPSSSYCNLVSTKARTLIVSR